MGMSINADKLRPSLRCDWCGSDAQKLTRVNVDGKSIWVCDHCIDTGKGGRVG